MLIFHSQHRCRENFWGHKSVEIIFIEEKESLCLHSLCVYGFIKIFERCKFVIFMCYRQKVDFKFPFSTEWFSDGFPNFERSQSWRCDIMGKFIWLELEVNEKKIYVKFIDSIFFSPSVDSRKKCEGFAKYFNENLGPIAQSFASDDISVKIFPWLHIV